MGKIAEKTFSLTELMYLYQTSMVSDERGVMPHIFGPPGVGKTYTIEQAANLLDVNLHVFSVARMNPLEVEGYDMPVDENKAMKFLLNTRWENIQEGDIVLWDEFLRGFPEVYNAILDITTSRTINGHRIPRSLWIGASNSISTYDPALADRLLHIPVVDARSVKNERTRIAQVLCVATGMDKRLVSSMEMDNLIAAEILPTYGVMDDLKSFKSTGSMKGTSLRNLIGQVRLRHIQSQPLWDLILKNNSIADEPDKIYTNGLGLNAKTLETLEASTRLTPIQRENLEIHQRILELHNMFGATKEVKEEEPDDMFT